MKLPKEGKVYWICRHVSSVCDLGLFADDPNGGECPFLCRGKCVYVFRITTDKGDPCDARKAVLRWVEEA